MHVSLALVIGVLIAVGVILVYVAVYGISFLGLGVSDEIVLAIAFFIVAAIIIMIFATGFKAQFKSVKTGKEALIDSIGIAVTDINPKGEIRVMSEFWQAVAQDSPIMAGQNVKVIGNRLPDSLMTQISAFRIDICDCSTS